MQIKKNRIVKGVVRAYYRTPSKTQLIKVARILI